MANERKDIVATEVLDSRQARQEQERAERDYEMFLQDLEEDDELRQNINLYKSEKKVNFEEGMESEIEEDEDAPEINIDELLDELDEMNIDG